LEQSSYQPGTPEYAEFITNNLPDPLGVPSSVTEAQLANPELETGVTVVVNASGEVVTVWTGPSGVITEPDLIEL
jgi:hypothetical protein